MENRKQQNGPKEMYVIHIPESVFEDFPRHDMPPEDFRIRLKQILPAIKEQATVETIPAEEVELSLKEAGVTFDGDNAMAKWLEEAGGHGGIAENIGGADSGQDQNEEDEDEEDEDEDEVDEEDDEEEFHCSLDSPTFTSVWPIPKKEPNAKKFLSDLRKLSPLERHLLALMTHVGATTGEILGMFISFCMPHDNWINPREMEKDVMHNLERLAKKGYLAEYRIVQPEGITPMYCFTRYGWGCMHKASVLSAADYLFDGIRIANHRFIGQEEQPSRPLKDKVVLNFLVAGYVCSQMADPALQQGMLHGEARGITQSLLWVEDHYEMLVRTAEGLKKGRLIPIWEPRPESDGRPMILLSHRDADQYFPDVDTSGLNGGRLYRFLENEPPDSGKDPNAIDMSLLMIREPEPEPEVVEEAELRKANETMQTVRKRIREIAASQKESSAQQSSEMAASEVPGAPGPDASGEPVDGQPESETPAAVGREAGNPDAETAPEQNPSGEEKPAAAAEPAEGESPAEKTESEEPEAQPVKAETTLSKKQRRALRAAQLAAEHAARAEQEQEEKEQTPAEPVQNAQAYARELLEEEKDPSPEQLLQLTVRLLAEGRFAEATALTETLSRAGESGKRYRGFHALLRQGLQVPGTLYRHSSGVIRDLQKNLAADTPEMQGLEQTLLQCCLLWALAFPSAAYDSNLYGQARSLLQPDDPDEVEQLVDLLGVRLKDLSFTQDGMGFSPWVLSRLSGAGEREERLAALEQKAALLRDTPVTSSVRITGLEACLKSMVGRASPLGAILNQVACGDRTHAAQMKRDIQELFGDLDQNPEQALEDFIDLSWSAIRSEDGMIRIKHLAAESPARRVCLKSLKERLDVITLWLDLVSDEGNSGFARCRDEYAGLLAESRTCLERLQNRMARSSDPFDRARCALLGDTARRMRNVLDGKEPGQDSDFFLDLCRTPELILDENGENIIVPELYRMPGMEPWMPLVRAAAAGRENLSEILAQIENYECPRWYRNYGVQALLRENLGMEPVQPADLPQAEQSAREQIQSFRSEARLGRACGRISASVMETALRTLDLVQDLYFSRHNYAGMRGFLEQLKSWLKRDTDRRAKKCERRVADLETDERYADARILGDIRRALADRNFLHAEDCMDLLRSGIRELPDDVSGKDDGPRWLRQFRRCEDRYYEECQSRQHRTESMARWGERTLRSMEPGCQHWSSPAEKRKGCALLTNWITVARSRSTPYQIQSLLTGLGFQVRNVEPDNGNRKPGASCEVYRVSAEQTARNLRSFPHPVSLFGTGLGNPLYVVCLYGCRGESTLVDVMTRQLELDGPAIVLMDGALTAQGRGALAARFRTDVQGGSPFLVIDRVLMMYLASLDEEERFQAMLQCTLPAQFVQLYNAGFGTIPAEMFFGRERELTELCSDRGPSLVWGGRQMGKTALLNRACQILHAPERGEYAFCVNLDRGGSDVLRKQLSLKLRQMNLLDDSCEDMEELCSRLETGWKKGQIRRLRVFVDDADPFLEEARMDGARILEPILRLRDRTGNKVKFVFSGIHNAAAAAEAEGSGSCLLRMGEPLCVGPLSVGAAKRLIRTPLAYLGFEIQEPQTDLILALSGCCPGLIQAFCRNLVLAVSRDFHLCFGMGGGTAPFRIGEKQMLTVFRTKDMRRELTAWRMSGLKTDRRYEVVSALLAHMTCEDQEMKCCRLHGYSARALADYNLREFRIPLLTALGESGMEVLLNEMSQMGILRYSSGTRCYRFRRQEYLGFVGTSEQILDFLLNESEEEEMAV